jgi:hypothetical protein
LFVMYPERDFLRENFFVFDMIDFG